MEKIIDIYIHFKSNDEMFDKRNRLFGRIIVDEDRLVEGIVTTDEDDNRSLIFGTIDGDLLNLNQCSRNDEAIPNEIIAELNNGVFKGIISEISYDIESPTEECKVVLIPADKTREESEYEFERLKAKIEDIKEEIPKDSRSLYHAFRIENKIKQKRKK